MHYIITDIHNDNRRFTELLQKINLTEKDHLYLLGDLFDRCEDHADPVGVYFQMLGLGEQCTVIRGNHDHWLANYIFRVLWQGGERPCTFAAISVQFFSDASGTTDGGRSEADGRTYSFVARTAGN